MSRGSGARPPHWSRLLARLLVRGPHREFVLGDLEEMWSRSSHRGSRATVAYLGWAVGSAALALRSATWLGLRMDLLVALRQFRKQPRVYLGGALVLSIGLGISTLAWGVRYGATGRDVAMTAPDRVLGVQVVTLESKERSALSIDDAALIRRSVPDLEAFALWTSGSANLVDDAGPPQLISFTAATAELLQMMEATPTHGRLLLPADDHRSAVPVAVLGHAHWVARYGSDPTVVGRSIRIDGRQTEVVGVLGPGQGLTAAEDVWLPSTAIAAVNERTFHGLARIAPEAAIRTTEERLAATAAGRARSADPAWIGRSLVMESFAESFYGGPTQVRDRVLAIGAFLLFVMAVANVANLFSVTTRARAQELAVRRALGAGRIRILRQLIVEAGIPCVLGFVGAAAIADATLTWYQAAANAYGTGFTWQLYQLEAPHVVLLLVGSVASTVAVSIVAASRELSGRDAPGVTRARGEVASTFRFGRALLGVEVAVGAALLLLSSLMIRSAWNLRSVDFDFATENVMTADLTLRGTRYDDPEARIVFWESLEEILRTIPGVQEATVGGQLPLIRCCNNRFHFEVEGWDVDDPATLPIHYGNGVSPSYFDTFQHPVLSGRGVAHADREDSEPIAVVNTHFAAEYFPGQSPIGRRIRLWSGDSAGPWRTVVGIAPHLWMDTDVNATPHGVYLPLTQLPPRRASFAIRVDGAPESYADPLRAAVQRLDPELPVSDVRSMPQLFRDRTSLYRTVGPLFALLGIAALALAIGGLYSAVSYMASLRTPEFGLRAALGADRSELMTRSVAGARWPTGIGIAVGLAIGFGLTKGFDRFVFLVDPWSPAVVAATVLVLGACSALASLSPALKAGRVDPVQALRAD